MSLAELDAKASLLQRRDNKYLVTDATLSSVVEQLRATHQVLSHLRRRSFSYDSVYFDSPTYAQHLAHVQGRRLRWKVRTRTYGDGELCFAEVKLKGLRNQTTKVRRRIPLAEHGRATATLTEFADAVLREHYGHGLPTLLLPAVTVRYERATLVRRDGGERVTVDRGLELVGVDGAPGGRLRPGLALLEVKTEDGRGPVDEVLHARHERPVSLSKYGVGVALVHPHLPHAPLRRVLLTRFETAERVAAA